MGAWCEDANVSGTASFAWDQHTRVWESGALVAGGSPWRLSRLSGAAAGLARRAHDAGAAGYAPTAGEAALVDAFVDRGWLHPRAAPRPGPHDVTVIVPAFGRVEELRRTLDALAGLDVIVVDDGTPLPSPVAAVAEEYGVRCQRLDINSGPAAARNAGARSATSEFVAFVDSDCAPAPGWLDHLMPLFDDARVAVVAPRVAAQVAGDSVVARYERERSALDMGMHPALVRPGSRLGFVPSATMVARRSVVLDMSFDGDLRVGEDVDLVWRITDAGHHVRYQPDAWVLHSGRDSWWDGLLRRRDYGMSAPLLEQRHPGRLTPGRISAWNAMALAAAATGHPVIGASVVAVSAGLLARRFSAMGIPASAAARVVGMGVVADGVAVGHALRREYWPLGAAALATSPWSRAARTGAVLMIAPLVHEWLTRRPAVDPVRYIALRMAADAAYGAGVTTACVHQFSLAPLVPRVRVGFGRWTRGSGGRPAVASST